MAAFASRSLPVSSENPPISKWHSNTSINTRQPVSFDFEGSAPLFKAKSLNWPAPSDLPREFSPAVKALQLTWDFFVLFIPLSFFGIAIVARALDGKLISSHLFGEDFLRFTSLVSSISTRLMTGRYYLPLTIHCNSGTNNKKSSNLDCYAWCKASFTRTTFA